MHSPHRLRVVEGPEIHYFADESVKRFVDRESRIIYDVSSKTNRTGIRLEGPPLNFREEVDKSIISEGILPGTVQIPGDGLPIIMLYERTIGGYARMAMVVKADHDRLAHLKPGDYVLFEMVSLEEAEKLWEGKRKVITSLNKTVRRLS
jgi:allophanate hydrolase